MDRFDKLLFAVLFAIMGASIGGALYPVVTANPIPQEPDPCDAR